MHQSEDPESRKLLFVDRFVQWPSPHDDPVLSTHHSCHRRAQTSHQVHDADPGPRLHCIRSLIDELRRASAAVPRVSYFKTYNKLHMHPPASEKTKGRGVCSYTRRPFFASVLEKALLSDDPASCEVQLALANHPPATTQAHRSAPESWGDCPNPVAASCGRPHATPWLGPGTEQLSRSRNAHQASSFPFDPEVADSEMRGGQAQVSTGAVATVERGHSLSLARRRRCGRRAVGLVKMFQRLN
jgi:hypothetical protein